MKHILISNKTKFTLVDDEDYDRLSKFDWHLDNKGYATRTANGRSVRMHNEIMNFPRETVDHINRIKLDNQKSNLRFADGSTNQQNSTRKTNVSGYKGVSYHHCNSRFRAAIQKNHKWKHLGLFEKPEDAARAYDKAAIELFGPEALTNEKLGNFKS